MNADSRANLPRTMKLMSLQGITSGDGSDRDASRSAPDTFVLNPLDGTENEWFKNV